MAQPRICEIEKPGERRMNLDTLMRLASAFDVGLEVQFVPFSDLVSRSENFNPDSFSVKSFDHEIEELENRANRSQGAKIFDSTHVGAFSDLDRLKRNVSSLPSSLGNSMSTEFQQLTNILKPDVQHLLSYINVPLPSLDDILKNPNNVEVPNRNYPSEHRLIGLGIAVLAVVTNNQRFPRTERGLGRHEEQYQTIESGRGKPKPQGNNQIHPNRRVRGFIREQRIIRSQRLGPAGSLRATRE